VRTSRRAPRTSSALLVYVIILVAFQVFLFTVAVEAFATDDEALAWTTATVSVVLAGGSAFLYRSLRP
jgi:hypothetical protein